MENKNNKLIEMYNSIMEGYEPHDFVPRNWPMENGVYKQYSAYEQSNCSVSGTSYNNK